MGPALDRIHLLIWASALVDAVCVTAALLWCLRGGIGRLAGAAAALALLLVAKGVVLRSAGLDWFGAVHVLYLDAVVVVPLVGAVLLAAAWRRPLLRALGVALLLGAPAGAYASFVEPSWLHIERSEVPLPEIRAGREPVTVAVLADLQFRRVGAIQRSAVERVMRERPDVILLPGDLHQGGDASLRRALPRVRELLGQLRAPGGVYFVLGDVEGLDRARLQLAGTGVRLLRNEAVRVRVRDRVLRVGGTELDHRSPAARRLAAKLEAAPGRGDVRILLTHRPDSALTLPRGTRVDLVVAGHTHGGQVQLPLIGPLTIASRVPRFVGAGGLHDLGGGRRVYVSRGVGMERGQAPPLRFLAPPEASLLRLR